MQQLRRTFTNDVHAEQFLRGRIEKQLQSAGGVTANLAARDLAKIGHAHFVGNSFVRELLFRFANEGDFGNAVNPVRVIRAVGMDGHAEGAGGGDAALFHGNRAEAGKTNDVAHGENVQLLGSVLFINGNPPARVGVESGGSEI